ncbi:alpha-D-xyloside xylohydrolase [Actinoplanes octamycinicus]|uniref:alpha-D-xyloside xylohydrolase n=1 Tax=Actinoplanes octamycinicus TaxID=135948 RepID=A0A7W7GYF8_9ACTN|nr:alpha-xylosidase [Actinoplanes octamycinicus]MBB4740619.1 alpha-D-xyloside xylohydrolase [Actinoplanes octamycinicus]GIE63078.1 alpha-xylosidase [Actinoplanes octamycinicus]
MKFTDGYWRKRDGLTVLHPAHHLDSAPGPESLTVYAATRRIQDRGDTLDAPLITVTLTAPMNDVIRVTVEHFQGVTHRGPDFALEESTADISVSETSFTSGALTARINNGDNWALDFLADGKRITGSGWKGMGIVSSPGGAYVHEQLDLGVGEVVYGLGERFGPLIKNGQSIDIWNEDGGTSSEQSYKNVPFYFTNAGYGVLVDHPGKVSFEVASEMVTRTQFSVAGQSMSYLVIHGPTPADVIRKYTALTGRPALPPAWSFGLWLTTSFTTSYDEETVNKFVDGMADRDLPLSVFHFDTFWMREFNWCDFEWDTRIFPDPPGMLKRLAGKGLKVCLWINPYIAQRSPLFAEGKAQGFLVRTVEGDVWQWDRWQAGMALVDFTNPDAREWYAAKLRALVEMGVDAFKSDFGERIPVDGVVWHDGSDPERMHNYYTQLYNQVVFDVLREAKGEGEAVLFARSATVGGQQFPVHWGGDNTGTFESMAESLRGGLSLMSSGFGFWSHDIGGFEGLPDPAVFKRWVAFGLLSSHSRLHGSKSYRVPWNFDEESVDVLRFFTHLKYRLMPYLFGVAREAHLTGLPVMRPMVLGFPDDPAATYLDRQYLLGGDLLVAPVFSAAGEVSCYVPAGRWTRYLTGEVVEGPGWVRETHDFFSVPLLVRPGAVIPVGARQDRPDYDYRDGVTLRLFSPAEGRTAVVVPGPAGADTVFTVVREGAEIRVGRSGEALPWRVQLGTAITDLAADQDSCTLTLG